MITQCAGIQTSCARTWNVHWIWYSHWMTLTMRTHPESTVSYRDTTTVDGRRKGFIQQFKLVKVHWGADCQASSSGIFCQSGQFPVHKTLILAPNWLITSYFLMRPLLHISSSCGGPKMDIFKPIISPRIEQIKQLVFLSKMKLQPILSFLTQFSLSALLLKPRGVNITASGLSQWIQPLKSP